jgi:threonine dehydrogenase-like Zn-dependent dehydrogenase
VVDPGGDDMAAAVVDLTGGRGFDVCIEASRVPAGPGRLLRPRHAWQRHHSDCARHPAPADRRQHPAHIEGRHLQEGLLLSGDELATVIGLSASGAIPAEQIVTAVDSLHELSAGFEELLDPAADALKIIISV